MRLLDSFLAILSLVGFVLLGWWAVYQSPQSAASLERALQEQATASLADIHPFVEVEMDGQRAILSGAVSPASDAPSAEKTVSGAVGPGGLWLGGITKVETAFSGVARGLISPYVWQATKTDDGRIILNGHVPSDGTRRSLVAFAGRLAPNRVDDRAKVGFGAPEGDWLGAAQLGLGALLKIDSGVLTLNDTGLSLTGLAMDPVVRAEASAAIANVPEPFIGQPNIKGLGLWSARHVPGALVLAGRVASEDEKDEIVAIARTHYDGRVRDEMVLGGNDHENWLQGVMLGLPHFSRFESGSMAFKPDGAGFVFEGEASGSTLAYLREDMATLTGPYAVAIEADAVDVAVEEISGIDFSGDPVEACQAAFDAVLEDNTVEFASGSAEITRESGEALDKLMAVSARCAPGLVFELGGHTDNSGDRAFNIVLSEQRAGAVADYMISSGFDGARLGVKGYGPDVPIADNATGNGRAANRRLEFKVQDGSNE